MGAGKTCRPFSTNGSMRAASSQRGLDRNNNGSFAKGEENEQEIEDYRGEGELIIKRTEHRGAARKVMGIAEGLPTLSIGYLIIGKDKTRKYKAEGLLMVTNKAI